MTRTTRLAAALGTTLLLAACGTAGGVTPNGADDAPVTLLSVSYNVTGRSGGDQLVHLVQQVKELSGGSLTLVAGPEPDSGAADTSVATIKAVEENKVQLGIVSARTFDTLGVSSFQALQAPYLVTSNELADKILADPLADDMLQATEKLDVVGIGLAFDFAAESLLRRRSDAIPGSLVAAASWGIAVRASDPVPFAVAIGVVALVVTALVVVRVFEARAQTSELARALEQAGDVEQTLASAMHDPGLRVTYVLAEGLEVRPDGSADAPTPDEVVTDLVGPDGVVARVHHGVDGVDSARLADAVRGPGRLALENGARRPGSPAGRRARGVTPSPRRARGRGTTTPRARPARQRAAACARPRARAHPGAVGGRRRERP